jgi:hypothetical protein
VLIATEYESFLIISVFKDKKQAIDLKEICQEYEKTKPVLPTYNDDTLTIIDSVMEEYDKKSTEWAKNHPSGKDTSYYDTFVVDEQEFIE